MRLLERPVEFLLLQSEVPTDHDGATTCEISEKKEKKKQIVLSFVTSRTIALIALSIKRAIFFSAMFVETEKTHGRIKKSDTNLIIQSK